MRACLSGVASPGRRAKALDRLSAAGPVFRPLARFAGRQPLGIWRCVANVANLGFLDRNRA